MSKVNLQALFDQEADKPVQKHYVPSHEQRSSTSKTTKRIARQRDEAYYLAHRQGCIERDNTYQAVSNAKPEVQAKISASMKGKQKTQEHLDKVAAKTRERAKPVIVPWGVFRSGKLAGDAYNELHGVRNGQNRVSHHAKKGTAGYKFISIEEYIMLTGKEM